MTWTNLRVWQLTAVKKGWGFILCRNTASVLVYQTQTAESGIVIIFAGSKTENAAQRRYCPIEGECLAAAYGVERCRMYALRCPDLILAVNHKPLINILNDRHLDTIPNPYFCRLKENPFHLDSELHMFQGVQTPWKLLTHFLILDPLRDFFANSIAIFAPLVPNS